MGRLGTYPLACCAVFVTWAEIRIRLTPARFPRINEPWYLRHREIVKRFYLDEEEKDSICHALELSVLHFDKAMPAADVTFVDPFNQLSGPAHFGESGHTRLQIKNANRSNLVCGPQTLYRFGEVDLRKAQCWFNQDEHAVAEVCGLHFIAPDQGDFDLVGIVRSWYDYYLRHCSKHFGRGLLGC